MSVCPKCGFALYPNVGFFLVVKLDDEFLNCGGETKEKISESWVFMPVVVRRYFESL